MAKAHTLPAHPEELFVLSSPPTHHGKTECKVWYASRLREVIFLLADGNGWGSLMVKRKEGPPTFGRLTLMHRHGVLELAPWVALAWVDYVIELEAAGVRPRDSYGDDPSISWAMDLSGYSDLAKPVKAAFVKTWEERLTAVIGHELNKF